MKTQTKIHLSAQEVEVVNNVEWILTKNSIMQKTKWLLENIQIVQQAFLEFYKKDLPAEIFSVSPKISKGENYQGLPWLILDCPRYFDKEKIFAIRSFFWWGNFFSITLHLSGKYKNVYEQKIFGSYKKLKEQDFFYCINEDEWEHHFESNNYISLNKMGQKEFSQKIKESSFIKLAKKISLQEWNNIEKTLPENFEMIIKILTDQLPRR